MSTVNKAQLSELIAQKIGITKRQAEESIDLLIETIMDTIKTGGEVTFTGFGTFSARVRKGRIGINPRNPSQQIEVPPVKVVKFKAGKVLKDTLKASQGAKPAPVEPQAPAAPVMPPAPSTPTPPTPENPSV